CSCCRCVAAPPRLHRRLCIITHTHTKQRLQPHPHFLPERQRNSRTTLRLDLSRELWLSGASISSDATASAVDAPADRSREQGARVHAWHPAAPCPPETRAIHFLCIKAPRGEGDTKDRPIINTCHKTRWRDARLTLVQDFAQLPVHLDLFGRAQQ